MIEKDLLSRRIIAHRGYWLDKADQNSEAALTRAMQAGFGVEFDVRDLDKDLVISHDPPSRNAKCYTFSDLQRERESLAPDAIFAINVKSDGLLPLFKLLPASNSCFFFDMSFPESMKYQKAGMPVAERISEHESPEARVNAAQDGERYWWIDSFSSDWFLDDDKLQNVCGLPGLKIFVSPELHNRDNFNVWTALKTHFLRNEKLFICTDKPTEFLDFCNG